MTYRSTTNTESDGGLFGKQTTDLSMDVLMTVISKREDSVRVKSLIRNPTMGSGMSSLAFGGSRSRFLNVLNDVTYETTYSMYAMPSDEIMTNGTDHAKMLAHDLATDVGFARVCYPKDEVCVGSLWHTDLPASKVLGSSDVLFGPAKGTVPVNYKLVDIFDQGGKRYAVVEYTIKGAYQIGPSDFAMTMDADLKGKIRVETPTGLPVEKTSTGSITTKFGTTWMSQKVNESMNLAD
jgi:hypothetical protein